MGNLGCTVPRFNIKSPTLAKKALPTLFFSGRSDKLQGQHDLISQGTQALRPNCRKDRVYCLSDVIFYAWIIETLIFLHVTMR